MEDIMGKEDIGLIRTDLSEYSGQYGHIIAAMGKIGETVTRWPQQGDAARTVQNVHDASATIDKFITMGIEDVNLDAN